MRKREKLDNITKTGKTAFRMETEWHTEHEMLRVSGELVMVHLAQGTVFSDRLNSPPYIVTFYYRQNNPFFFCFQILIYACRI